MAKRSSGFTLIEVIIAVAILGVLMTIIYSTLNQVIKAKILLDDRRDGTFIANAVLNRVSREIQMAFSGVPLLPRPDEAEGKPLPSTINLIGEEKQLAGGAHGDSIRFVALEAGQYLPDGGTHSGLVQIMYRVEKDPDAQDEKRHLLIREETPLIRPNEEAFSRMMIFPITKDLVSFKLRYYDQEEEAWRSSWGDDEHNRLPEMVEFTIEVASPQGNVQSFTSAVALRAIY